MSKRFEDFKTMVHGEEYYRAMHHDLGVPPRGDPVLSPVAWAILTWLAFDIECIQKRCDLKSTCSRKDFCIKTAMTFGWLTRFFEEKEHEAEFLKLQSQWKAARVKGEKEGGLL